ncbi:toxin-antitoxin system TumE family protein [Thiorhodovibrio frisius]|uniref:Uncharacterized protein n=1 Tax=Thiorhodovibrio frisius TaxID=631362 RepID=H8Z264_9GAMM|nr:DUF6516 family protein [Thiorhodovibrio frisius]EIC22626.1 hypothetical protein Thi970DRAFT_02904 [Thiorhodovibrio frisius]WPL20069.1 hypothetical protein Thiofri_00123 [Thiorhodovibrio frisius]
MNPFQSLADYEAFIYGLESQFTAIRRSTLVVVRRGATVAVLRGELEFDHGIRLNVRERLTFDHSPGKIREYGYEVWQEGRLLYWYDSQPHPDDPTLTDTHPHHRHVHPDIKHHRIPAPGLSFQQPNIPFLLQEIGELELARPQDPS